ncbi:DddA-like double-stranded DNA deaminase toxin [Kutzneria chonburiensis]|uniref:DddA-like double-stranded DNA deaminase toxin n=1 Tax=Kutzneria chonburiensis TaxID=1483604 RepID=UPI00236009B6|nr:DddA-like double-stranded DNA deaminase toxin [Kutzneria chonburiensis]
MFDAAGADWQVNSGVDPALTAAARQVIERMIANGEVGTSGNAVTDSAERTAMRDAASHAETKAAVWAAANGKKDVDVVTNRDFVCGDDYAPGNRRKPPGCAQAAAAILPAGYRMRVWRRGVAKPLVIRGRGKKG